MSNANSYRSGIGAWAIVWLGIAAVSTADDGSLPGPGPVLETLLSEALEGVEGTEVIVSRVMIPPNTALPRHWHPGEEFAYVLEGAAILRRDGQDDVLIRAGEVGKIPLKQVHTAVTTDEGATILVFRVHRQGLPERTLVE